MRAVIVKHDQSPVADLKRPYKTRARVDSEASGAIELAYWRGEQAGFERATKTKSKRAPAGEKQS